MPYNAIEADQRVPGQKKRHSLEPTTVTEVPPTSSLRHTQSQRYNNKPNDATVKNSSLSTVLEIYPEENKKEYVKEKVRKTSSVANSGRLSKLSQQKEITKEDYAYDNASFDRQSEKISLSVRPIRAPSVQSLG